MLNTLKSHAYKLRFESVTTDLSDLLIAELYYDYLQMSFINVFNHINVSSNMISDISLRNLGSVLAAISILCEYCSI